MAEIQTDEEFSTVDTTPYADLIRMFFSRTISREVFAGERTKFGISTSSGLNS